MLSNVYLYIKQHLKKNQTIEQQRFMINMKK